VKSAPPGFLRLDDCFLEGPVDRATDWLAGGVDYHHCIIQIGGLATAADSLAAIQSVVSSSGAVTMEGLRRALAVNFEGQDDLRARLVAAPKFGNDLDLPDELAARLVNGICDDIALANASAPERLYRMIPCVSTDMQHIAMGAKLGATPNGRLAGEPISENQSPSPGQDRRGLTALLSSLSRLPFRRITGGPLNLRVHPSLVSGDDGLERFAAALRTYLDRGGLQVQVSCVGRETLRAAQENPDAYRDLTVRITGYSAYFVDMSRLAQDEIIGRSEIASRSGEPGLGV